MLVGVAADSSFAVESFELAPGESLVLYSDGLEQIVRHTDAGAAGSLTHTDRVPGPGPDTTGPDKYLAHADWYTQLRKAGLPAALEQLGARHDMLRRLGQPLDDLTVLAISAER
jgi:hypothetical protein